jgi:signal peptidase I
MEIVHPRTGLASGLDDRALRAVLVGTSVCYSGLRWTIDAKMPTQMRIAMKSPDRSRARPDSRRTDAPAATSTHGRRQAKSRSGRESIESFVVVFASFLIWSLEAEGFVIPTGSMAPTLMGRHKEIVCPQCGYSYTVNADREVESSGRAASTSRRVESGTCENCRFQSAVADAPSFSGDRIYVMKDGLSLPFLGNASRAKLRRWDVAVFKLPEEPEVRYIKRLVGMPNEVVKIDGGDLWVQPLDRSRDFDRLRRTLHHQQAMQMMVYDDAHRARALDTDLRWRRWAPAPAGGWSQPSPGLYALDSSTPDWTELQYEHIVPSPAQWAAIQIGEPLPVAPRSSLITDYYSYNTDLSADDQSHPRLAARPWFQPHWVGDLTLSVRLQTHEPAGQVRLELIKAGVSNRCEIDLGSGEARLFHGSLALGGAVKTAITRAGAYELVFANVDGRLTLWVDGRLPFEEGRTYDSRLDPPAPAAADLRPARIAARRTAAQINRLVLKRDIYYTLEPSESDYSNLDGSARVDASALLELLSDPTRFSALVRYPAREYPIGPGHFLMLGDNSPWSRDGRAWASSDQINPDFPDHGWDNSGRQSWEVPEALLIGKAFCVYWPHPKPVWPQLRIGADTRLPILPYIERMRWIR